jgi:hypothetical protein
MVTYTSAPAAIILMPISAPKKKLIVKSSKEGDDEEIPNPAFTAWKAQEQQVPSYLLTSVSRDVLIQIAALPWAREA